MSDAVVELLVENLNSLIQRQFGLVWGVDEDISRLSSILSTIRNVLEDAEIKQFSDKPIANWLEKLKDTAYDAGDVLDEWLTDAQQTSSSNHAGSSTFSCLSLNNIKFRHKIARKIKKLIAKFDEIAEERLKFHLSPGFVQTGYRLDESRETSSFLAEEIVYGRDGEKEEFIDVLINMDHAEDISVLSIIGIGGLGKTTLAQLVYKDQRVVEHFDVRIWVCVSDDFEVKRLTRTILESLTGNACNLENLDPMQRQLEQKLSGKRFLLVLDDVWNEDPEKWCKLKPSLTCGAKGSSIIVTTRLESVTSIMCTLPPHCLTFLSEEESLSLFKRYAFGVGNDGIADMLEIGKGIVKKCGGVPLAAKTLGGLMYSKRVVSEWLHVRDSEIWELPQDKKNGILPALRLSYNHLPSHLRKCFAFCSIYPKDHKMEKEELIHLWMANGFVQPVERMELEDYGNQIFNELSRRSFFQDIKIDDFDEKETCKMHDLMHDLACLVSENECSVVEVGKENTFPRGIRHRSVMRGAAHSSNPPSLSKSNQLLRTQLFIHNYIEPPQTFFKNLECLRALDLSHIRMSKLPVSIGKMKHLRYLNLSHTDITVLPESICNLKSLQCLKLRCCLKLKMLPSSLGRMRSLRHLDIIGCDLNQMPIGMGQLTHLHTMSKYVIGPERGRQIKELQGLNHLGGELMLEGLEHVGSSEEAKEANLIRKQNISELSLEWTWLLDVTSGDIQEKVIEEGLQPHPSLKVLSIKGYAGKALPSWMMMLPNLVKITLWCFEKCESLPPLGQIPHLKELTIWYMDSLKCIGRDFYGEGSCFLQGFRSLEELSIGWMPVLNEWWPLSSEENAGEVFPCLRKLTINFCPKLIAFPSLPVLQDLELGGGNEMILSSLRNPSPSLHNLIITQFEEMTCLPEGIFTNSTALRSLDILHCYKLKSLPSELGVLTALTSLAIVNCREVVSLPVELQNLTTLQRVRISGCDSFKFFQVMGLQGLNTSLLDLHIQSCAKLETLSEGLRYLTSLKELHITACPELELSVEDFQHLISVRTLEIGKSTQLKALPEGIQHLTMLQHLGIEECENLRALPEWLQQLTALQSLNISNCHPDLHRRCEREEGEDWHKISHISDFDIYRLPKKSPTSAGCSAGLLNKLTNTCLNNDNHD